MPVYLAEVFLMIPMAYILVLGEIDISVGATVCLFRKVYQNIGGHAPDHKFSAFLLHFQMS